MNQMNQVNQMTNTARPQITEFSGQYRWLSNFWMATIQIEGIRFPSAEHAYQAAKSPDKQHWLKILGCTTPAAAKRAGGAKTVDIWPNWDKLKLQVMETVLGAKFSQHPDLLQRLLDTGDAELIEGNTWGDKFWGVSGNPATGENHLGKMLMKGRVRIPGSSGQ